MINVLITSDLASLEKAWMQISVRKLKAEAKIDIATYPPVFRV
jgi:hypothetical protein